MAWHGRGTAWARHAMCESALTDTSVFDMTFTFSAQFSPNVREPAQALKAKYVLVSQEQQVGCS